MELRHTILHLLQKAEKKNPGREPTASHGEEPTKDQAATPAGSQELRVSFEKRAEDNFVDYWSGVG